MSVRDRVTGTERAQAARLIATLDTQTLVSDWAKVLAGTDAFKDVVPTEATVQRIIAGLQAGLAKHLEAPRAKLDVDTNALADDGAMAHVFQRGITIAQINEGVFAFIDVVFSELAKADLFVPAVAELVVDFGKRFLRIAGDSWSSILLTQRNEAERSRAELHRLLEATNDGILLVGKDLSLRYTNRRAGDLLGVPLAAHIGENVHHLLTELVAPRLSESEAFLARTRHLYGTMEQVAMDEVSVQDPPRTLSRYSAPVRDPAGLTIGRIEVFRDVTSERKSMRQRDEFLGLVGHELRTPLAAISGYIDLASRANAKLQDAPEDSHQLERSSSHLRRARANVERIVRLVETLVTVDRFESGRWPLELRPLDLGEVISDAVANYAGASSRPITLKAPGQKVPISGDADRLEQIVANLLSNALRHASPTFTVEAILTVEGRDAVLTVADDGDGVPPGEQDRIFERFYRIPEGGYRSGIGLGLFIVRQLAIAHGGSVSAGEREGGGARFTVRLPLAK